LEPDDFSERIATLQRQISKVVEACKADNANDSTISGAEVTGLSLSPHVECEGIAIGYSPSRFLSSPMLLDSDIILGMVIAGLVVIFNGRQFVAALVTSNLGTHYGERCFIPKESLDPYDSQLPEMARQIFLRNPSS
jgi:hypothetical protein